MNIKINNKKVILELKNNDLQYLMNCLYTVQAAGQQNGNTAFAAESYDKLAAASRFVEAIGDSKE